MKGLILFVALFVSSPAWAQQAVVEAVKASVVAQGIDITGECGAFEITSRVAWELRAQGAGLVAKLGGSNCRGYSTDLIQFAPPTGHWFDILKDAGGENGPQWNDGGIGDGTVWRAPIDPGGGTTPQPPIPIPPQPPTCPCDVQSIHDHLDRLAAEWRTEAVLVRDRDAAHDQRLQKHDEEPAWITKVLKNPYVQSALVGITTWITAQTIKKD